MSDSGLALKDELQRWQRVAQTKRDLQGQAIYSFALMPPPKDADRITSITSISSLADLIRTGQISSYDATLAYIQRAIAAHEKTNCLTETLFANAVQRAQQLDDHLAKTSEVVGPLHGVPMTLKDQFDIQGVDSTLGYIGRCFKPAVEDANMVTILNELGVVFIAKTNLPQSIMWCETENPLWGLTTNPFNPDFTPGGSTGGESALLALQGTIMGWGTDIGGSVRIPAHMVGVYGFKPSSGRIPYQNVSVSTSGQEHVPSVVGPMARSLSSIQETMKLVIDSKPWTDDPTVHPLPWRDDVYKAIQVRPLVVGLMMDDGVVKVHPSIARVVKEVAAKLQEAGHKIVPWSADGHAECIQVMDKFYTADGGEDIKRDVAAGGEPFIPHVEALVSRAPAISVYEYWALNREKRAAQRKYLQKWQALRHPETSEEVDVLLTPVMPHPAVPHRKCKWVGYTKVWNLLDYTAIVLPGGVVDRTVDPPKGDPLIASYIPRNDLDKSNWELYDPALAHGMPIGIQLVGRRLEEEKVLGAAEVVERLLRGSV